MGFHDAPKPVDFSTVKSCAAEVFFHSKLLTPGMCQDGLGNMRCVMRP